MDTEWGWVGLQESKDAENKSHLLLCLHTVSGTLEGLLRVEGLSLPVGAIC